MIGFYSDNGEFIFENDGVSWLLWIHLLVMFLLIVVLYYFTVFVSDGAATSEVGQISAKKYGQLEEFRKCKNNYLSNNISRSSCSQDIKEKGLFSSAWVLTLLLPLKILLQFNNHLLCPQEIMCKESSVRQTKTNKGTRPKALWRVTKSSDRQREWARVQARTWDGEIKKPGKTPRNGGKRKASTTILQYDQTSNPSPIEVLDLTKREETISLYLPQTQEDSQYEISTYEFGGVSQVTVERHNSSAPMDSMLGLRL
ncbi:hypothetical protein BVC80_883g5 [Macleaya cordata]|uniref:Uncharacterized protein n=1 Tax=Macleaya cordata TaxID=56857 RepID=A0A200RD40_MACCD|nr:hypothetical protein BVC80_883g5 [Macleaya cordata]